MPAAAVLAYLVILRWAFAPEIAQLIALPGAAGEAAPQPWRTDIGAHIALGFGFAVLFGALASWRRAARRLPVIPILWSAASVATPLLILIALYWRIAGFERSIPFAGLALLLAALNGFATETARQARAAPGPCRRRRALRHRHRCGAGAGADLRAGKGLAHRRARADGAGHRLDRRTSGRCRCCAGSPPPAWCWWLARIGWEPRIVGGDVGTTPIFNWLLYGYGVPALSFWVGGYLLRRRADDQPARMVDAAAILFTVLHRVP